MANIALTFIPGVVASMLVMGAAPSAKAEPAKAWEESGEASWYGGWHNGKRTSSGQIYNQDGLTAAHAYLPLGSRIRVTMEDTGASVVVTINDRQPDHGYRIIDLSRGAAARIGLLGSGTGYVRITPATATEDVEVAETPEGDEDLLASPLPRGRRHTRRGAPAAWAGHPSSHARFAALAPR